MGPRVCAYERENERLLLHLLAEREEAGGKADAHAGEAAHEHARKPSGESITKLQKTAATALMREPTMEMRL
jgi:hypothetical protein